MRGPLSFLGLTAAGAMWYGSCMEQIAKGTVVLGDDFSQHRITGYVPHAAARGLDPNLDVPLISQVEDRFWQGGCRHGVKLPDEFDYVLSLYPWEQYTLGPNTYREEITMYDALDQDTAQVDELARRLADRLGDGANVLVHCQAGLNRSGLLAARTLTLLGHTGVEAISLLRAQRSPLVLCNETFENYIAGIK